MPNHSVLTLVSSVERQAVTRGVALAGFLLVLALPFATARAQSGSGSPPKLAAELELASVWQSKNEVQIPNDESSTRFSLVDLVGNGPTAAARLTVHWSLAERHGLHLLLAPFTLRERGTPEEEIRFAGETFEAGREVEATYRFNSWRVGYRYRFASGPRGEAWIGATAKLRDAKVMIEQGSLQAKDTDLGFVPLLHLAGRYNWSPRWSTSLQIEALGGGPGRAIDGAAKIRYGSPDGFGVSFGYRTIEGGADVDQVYNFAWLNFAVVSLDLPLR